MDNLPPQSERGKRTASPDWSQRLIATQPGHFSLTASGQLVLNGVRVASLVRGKKLTKPDLRLHLDEAAIARGELGPVDEHRSIDNGELRAELAKVLASKVASLLEPLSFGTDEGPMAPENSLLSDLYQQLRSGLGSLRLHQVQGLVRALTEGERMSPQFSRLVVGRRHVYLPESLSPTNVVTRLALLASHRGHVVPSPWKASKVLLLDAKSGLSHLSATDFERLGYELFGARAVRVDIVEQVLDPKFGQKLQSVLPSLMHTFRCSEEEAKVIARQLGLTGPKRPGAPSRQHALKTRSRRAGGTARGGRGSGKKRPR